MSEAELVLVEEAKNCTLYTIQFLSEEDTEFEQFFNKFKDDVEFSPDLMRIVGFIGKIADFGALERKCGIIMSSDSSQEGQTRKLNREALKENHTRKGTLKNEKNTGNLRMHHYCLCAERLRRDERGKEGHDADRDRRGLPGFL